MDFLSKEIDNAYLLRRYALAGLVVNYPHNFGNVVFGNHISSHPA